MTSKYEMWLTHDAEKSKMQFPVLPESIEIRDQSRNDSINISGLGEITILQDRAALEISFSSFFPASRFPGIQVASITPPLTLVNLIKEWKASDKPVHYVCTAGGNVLLDLYCSIENFEYSEYGGDPGTYQYNLTMKEYREITTRQVTVNTVTATATVQQQEPRVDNTVKPKTYTVKQGDTLSKIAKKVYGKPEKQTQIYQANKGIIGKNPNLILSGQMYVLP